MDLSELAQACADAIVRELPHEPACASIPPQTIPPQRGDCDCVFRNHVPRVLLVVPRLASRRSNRIRLAGPSSPLGRIVNEQERIESPCGWVTVADFDAEDVLRWLIRCGAKIECRVRPETGGAR